MRPALQPDKATFRALASRGNVVPVWSERLADLDTPVGAFLKVADEGPGFLLESVQGGERWAAFSFVGCDPWLTCVGDRGALRVEGPGGVTTLDDPDPSAALRSLLAEYRLALPEHSGAPMPRLVAGAVGFMGYDTVRGYEALPDDNARTDGAPEVALMIPGTLLAFDNLRQVIRVVRVVHIPEGADPDALWDAAAASVEATIARLEGPVPALPRQKGPELPTVARPAPADAVAEAGFSASMSRPDFETAVERAREYILAGDCIQVVLSQRFSAPADVPAFSVYRALRTTNPSPYMYFLRLPDGQGGEVEVAGASPEVLVRVDGDEALVRPIAGTRPRGETPDVDGELEAELLADPKERAEHVMLVDLGRNDLGRIAQAGSVTIPEQMVVERYSHVMHLVSEVRGRLAVGTDAFDVLASTFPAGTLSGAPKVRAMEIIDELETVRRSVYGGAVGYVGLDGNLDFCIGIRTLVRSGETMWVQAGAGIVADSVPSREWEETVHKAGSVLRAVQMARGGRA